MNGASNQLFSRSTFSGNKHAARLRRNRLNQIENCAHLGALSNDIVEPGKPAQLPPQITRLLFPPEAFAHFLDCAAQLVDVIVVLDDIAVGAGV